MAWKSKLFGDCAELVRETVKPSEVLGLRYIGLEHISQGQLSLLGFGIADDVVSTKSKFHKGDILFGKLRPYFRKVVIAPFDGVCSTDIWVVRAKPGTNQEFLFYWMASEEFVETANRASEGTKMPRAQWEFVEQIQQELPEESEQRRIASVLGALDDKIELNRRMNATLEAMARAVFRRWFVESEEVNNWDIGTISDFAQVTSGKRPENRQEMADTEFKYPLFGGGGIMAYTNKVLYDFPILLTGRVGTLGIIFRITDPCWASDNTLVLISSKSEYYLTT